MNSKNAVEGVVQPPKIDSDLNSLMPAMNVEVPVPVNVESKEDKAIISDEELVATYDEITNSIKEDRIEIDSILSRFVDMVINEGDSSTSSKEALVNLLKMKTDQADKMTKIADLKTRLKLKDRINPGGPWLNASQTNNINIGDSGQKRALLEAINKAKKEKR